MIGDAVSTAFIVAGALLALVAGIGLHRFPNVFARMHAATKPATLGLVLVVIGAALRVEEPGDLMKLLLIVGLQFLTAPVGAHMIGRAAFRRGEAESAIVVDEVPDSL